MLSYSSTRGVEEQIAQETISSVLVTPGGIKLWGVPNDILPTMTDPLMAAMAVIYHLLLNLHRLTHHNFDKRNRTDQLDTEQRGLIDPRCRL